VSAAEASDPYLDLSRAAAGLRDGTFTSVELTQQTMKRIEATEDRVQAFVTRTEEEALVAAEAADVRLKAGDAESRKGNTVAG
jgi:aspartyl-tRNA(Asn)/glutamyl-tRNA(Gln) amidotransferase subunit A